MQFEPVSQLLLPAFVQAISVGWPLLLLFGGVVILKAIIDAKFPDRTLKSRRRRSTSGVEKSVNYDAFKKPEASLSDESFDYSSLPVCKKLLMTAPEREFILRLEEALPECRIHTQVCMGAVMNPALPRYARGYMAVRGRFAQKIIDFVVEDRLSGDIVAIIELDDLTHHKAKDDDRDAMLKAAGYCTIRYRARSMPTVQEIRSRLIPQPSNKP